MPKVSGVSEVIAQLERWGKQKEANLVKASRDKVGPMLERQAKANRPWQDQTGDAKRKLHAKVEATTSDIAIQLHHGVKYGIYLEYSRAGKYAILRPTVESQKHSVLMILMSAWGD